MDLSKDYLKYLKSNKISSKYIDFTMQKSFNIFEESNMFLPTDIFTKLLKDRIIILSGEIDTHQCELIKANLLYLESIDSSDIKIYINSPGGSVYDGLGLLDIMEYITPEIETINTGLAASMAALILCSGKKGKRKALKRSRTMIHQPLSYGGFIQQASDMEIEAKEINNLKKQLYEIISNSTGQKYAKVHKDGDRDYWMSAIEAKSYGMIDEILIKRK